MPRKLHIEGDVVLQTIAGLKSYNEFDMDMLGSGQGVWLLGEQRWERKRS